jgi:hypothetical protein
LFCVCAFLAVELAEVLRLRPTRRKHVTLVQRGVWRMREVSLCREGLAEGFCASAKFGPAGRRRLLCRYRLEEGCSKSALSDAMNRRERGSTVRTSASTGTMCGRSRLCVCPLRISVARPDAITFRHQSTPGP